MSTLTKRQHYVWRKYLRAWLTDEKDSIYTAFKDQRKVNLVSLMGVGQQNYFYKMHEITEEDLKLMRSLVENAPAIFKGILSDMVFAYWSYTDIKKIYRNDPMIIQKRPSIEQEIKEIEINTFEKIEGKVELLGKSLLECKSIDDIKNLDVGDGILDIFLYFFVQHGRTKKMYDSHLKIFTDNPKYKSLIEHAFPFISLYNAFKLCYDMVASGWNIIFVKNKTSIPFITADQPIINYAYNEETEEGLELYYPTSPSTAVILMFDMHKTQYSEYNATEEFVNSRNNKMWNEALCQVFANNEEILKCFLTE